MSRRKHGTTITKKSRLLCPDGCDLQRVMFITPESYRPDPLTNTVVRLQCGHSRGELLPARGVSLETMGTSAGIAAFPPEQDAPRTPDWNKQK